MINIDKYTVTDRATVIEVLDTLNEQSSELTLTAFVINQANQVIGSITDGDVRRAILAERTLDLPVTRVMRRDFKYISHNNYDVKFIRELKSKNIKLVPVLDCDMRIIQILNLEKHKAILPLDAVLMAGGKGERLRPMTLTTPKPLLEVAGKPIIDYNVDNLLDHGVEHINVTTNYLAEQLEDHFKEPKQGVSIKCVKEPKFLGTMGSIKFVEHWYNDTILVMNSDLFTNIDLEDFFLHFKEHDADMSIAAVPYSVSIPYGIFEIEGQRNITGVREKPSYHYYANAGIYLIKRSVLDIIPHDTFFNATDLMELLISRHGSVIRFPLSGYWIDIGKPEDFKKVQDLAQHMQKR